IPVNPDIYANIIHCLSECFLFDFLSCFSSPHLPKAAPNFLCRPALAPQQSDSLLHLHTFLDSVSSCIAETFRLLAKPALDSPVRCCQSDAIVSYILDVHPVSANVSDSAKSTRQTSLFLFRHRYYCLSIFQ